VIQPTKHIPGQNLHPFRGLGFLYLGEQPDIVEGMSALISLRFERFDHDWNDSYRKKKL